MDKAVIYMEAIKRSLVAQHGYKQTSARRVLELTVATVMPGEFSHEQILEAFRVVCPCREVDAVAIANYEACLEVLAMKNAGQSKTLQQVA